VGGEGRRESRPEAGKREAKIGLDIVMGYLVKIPIKIRRLRCQSEC